LVIVLALLACMPEEDVLAHYDRDGDGFLHPEAEAQGVDGPFDCDDADDAIHPDAAEVCDGIDNNCDSSVDDGDAAPKTFFVDADADGFGTDSTAQGCEIAAGQSTVSGDCDDSAGAVFPGAEELWYDGVDQDCLGGDDYDADADGHRSDEHGGADCDDDDAAVYDGAPEGWYDIGTDNDCDGSVDDQVVLEAEDVVRIEGNAEAEDFGNMVVVLPAGWADPEPVVLVGASKWENYRGAAFAFTLGDLVGASSADDATWSWYAPPPTGEFGDVLASQLAWAGDETRPVSVISAIGVEDGKGATYGFAPEDFSEGLEGASFVVKGDVGGIYSGFFVPSGTDLDGDGTADLVVSATYDSRVDSGAGTVGVFYDPASLTGEVSYADADVMFTITGVGANLSAHSVGDADDDGADDLSFWCSRGDVSGLLFTDVPTSGTPDAYDGSVAQFLWSAPLSAQNLDSEPQPELITNGGIVRQYDLPVSGTVTPSQAAAESYFTDLAADWSAEVISRAPPWDGGRIVVSSYEHDNDRGWVVIDRLGWGVGTRFEEAKYLLEGEQAGDRFGFSMGLLDFDSDGVDDLLVSATHADGAYNDSGALYLVSRPQ
jgi:hypothetical protein